MIAFLNQLRELIDKIRGSNFKMVSTIALTFLVFGWAMYAPMFVAAFGRQFAIDVTVLGLLLGFLAAAWGINYKQFGKERDTDYGAMDRQAVIERAKATAASPVTVGTADTVKTGSGDVTVGAAAADPSNLVRVERPSVAKARDIQRREKSGPDEEHGL